MIVWTSDVAGQQGVLAVRAPGWSPLADEDTIEVIVASLAFAGIGWHTSADALLANTAAANAREQRRAARDEFGTATA